MSCKVKFILLITIAVFLLLPSVPGLSAGFGPGAASKEAPALSSTETSVETPVKLRIYGGEVMVDPAGDGKWIKAPDGFGIATGGSVRTSDDARAEALYKDGTVLRIQPSSEMTFLLDQVDLKRGDIWVRVTKRGAKFEVVTRTAVAGVRGTIFEVDVNPVNFETRVLVFEGKVEVQEALRRKGELVRGRSMMLEKGLETAVSTRSFPERPTSFAYAAKLRRWTDQTSWPEKEKNKNQGNKPQPKNLIGDPQKGQTGVLPDGKPPIGPKSGEGLNGEKPGPGSQEGRPGPGGMGPGGPGSPTMDPRQCDPRDMGPGGPGSPTMDPRMCDPRNMGPGGPGSPTIDPRQCDPRNMGPILPGGQESDGGPSTRDPRKCEFQPTRDPRQCDKPENGSLITRDPRACGIPDRPPDQPRDRPLDQIIEVIKPK